MPPLAVSEPESSVAAAASPVASAASPVAADGNVSWLSEWEEKCEKAIPGLNSIFEHDAISDATRDTFAEGCEKFVVQRSRKGLSKTKSYAEIWKAICFAAGNSNKNWTTVHGSFAMDLRDLIVREVVKGTTLRAGPGPGNRRQLSALSVVNDDNIQKGKNRKAGRASRGRNLRRRSCSENDAANEAANKLFSKAGKMQRQGRQRMTDYFFREVGYVYVPWSEARVELNKGKYCISKATLQVVLAKDKESVWDDLIEEAPSMIVSSGGEATATNEQALADMTKKADACGLKIEHEVVVRTNGGVGRGKKIKPINFLTVAHKMVMAYTRCDESAFLRSSKNSLRTIVGLAKIQYMLASKVIELGSLHADGDMDATPEVSVESARLSDFMPRLSRKKSNLETGCCLKGSLYA